MEILEVKNLNVHLSGRTILKDLNFSIGKGEMTAILGPNGAGKTVLLKAILNLLSFEGRIKWMPGAKIGYVPQRFAIAKDIPLTVREFFKLKTDKEEEVMEILKDLEVGPDEHHIAHHILDARLGVLSGGEQQKVLIAWAMIGNPNVLLFDEPTAGVDIGSETNIYQLLKKLDEKKSVTIIFITHDINIIGGYAEKVICLNKELICSGTPEEAITPENLKKLYGPDVLIYAHKHK